MKLIFDKVFELIFGVENKVRESGVVKWFNKTKGYGFIKPDNGDKDIFVHISAVHAAELEDLQEKQRLEYTVVEKNGKESAESIKLL